MNLARSTFYAEPGGQPLGDAKVVQKIGEICAEYPRYGYRRVVAQLHREGLVVNHKRAMRIMREQGLSVRPRRRFVATTDSNHGGPIFPNLARGLTPAGPNELWVADLTFIAIARGFVYLAVILECLVAACRWLCRRAGYRHAADVGGPSLRNREPSTQPRMCAPFGSWSTVRCGSVSRDARRAWAARFDGPSWRPL